MCTVQRLRRKIWSCDFDFLKSVFHFLFFQKLDVSIISLQFVVVLMLEILFRWSKRIYSQWLKKKKKEIIFSIIIVFISFVYDFFSNLFICIRVFICNLICNFICNFICFIFNFIFNFIFSSICISVCISVRISVRIFTWSRFACLSTFKSIWIISAFIKQISFDLACFV